MGTALIFVDELPARSRSSRIFPDDIREQCRLNPGKWGLIRTYKEEGARSADSAAASLRKRFGEDFEFAARGSNLYAKSVQMPVDAIEDEQPEIPGWDYPEDKAGD